MKSRIAAALLALASLGLLVSCQQQGPEGQQQQGNPDFRLVLNKATVTLSPYAPTAEVLVQVVAKNRFSGQVTLSLEGVPEGLSATFNPSTVSPQSMGVVTGIGAATLLLNRSAAQPGEYTIKVAGQNGSLRREVPLVLSVVAPRVVLNVDFSQGIPTDWEIVDHTGNGRWSTEDECERERDYGPLNPIQAPFAIIDSDCLGFVDVDTELRTPTLNLSAYSMVKLRFDHFFYSSSEEIGDVDVSVDGGNTWTNVARFQGEDVGPETHVVDISNIAGGRSNVVVRFRYYNAYFDWFWIVDNILIETL